MIESYVDYADVDVDFDLGVCLCVCDKKMATYNRETDIFLLAMEFFGFLLIKF